MCHNSMKKNNDTKDYSEQLEFLNSQPYYASKKIVIQSSDFLVPSQKSTGYALVLRVRSHTLWKMKK